MVVDSHSTGTTRELAGRLVAHTIERDWPGYRSQKQFAVAHASNDWVLCLDADERVSERLRAEIKTTSGGGFAGFAGWLVPRITDYFGRFLRHGNAALIEANYVRRKYPGLYIRSKGLPA
jgi:glycosyltransferase involved in cell wall biosynthesis